MPNYKVFQDNPNQLQTKIYGADGAGTPQPLLTSSSGALAVSGDVSIASGTTVGVSGTVDISGQTVVVSGQMVGVSGTVVVSGQTVGVSGNVTLSGHTIVDSGPTDTSVVASGSGVLTGSPYDVLSYSSWTLAVQYSGTSGDAVTVQLKTSAIGSGNSFVLDSSGTFTSGTGPGSWLFFTAGITPRYAQLYYVNAGTASGDLLAYFQAQN